MIASKPATIDDLYRVDRRRFLNWCRLCELHRRDGGVTDLYDAVFWSHFTCARWRGTEYVYVNDKWVETRGWKPAPEPTETHFVTSRPDKVGFYWFEHEDIGEVEVGFWTGTQWEIVGTASRFDHATATRRSVDVLRP